MRLGFRKRRGNRTLAGPTAACSPAQAGTSPTPTYLAPTHTCLGLGSQLRGLQGHLAELHRVWRGRGVRQVCRLPVYQPLGDAGACPPPPLPGMTRWPQKRLPWSSSCSSLSAAFSSFLCRALSSRRLWNLGRKPAPLRSPPISPHLGGSGAQAAAAKSPLLRLERALSPTAPYSHSSFRK